MTTSAPASALATFPRLKLATAVTLGGRSVGSDSDAVAAPCTAASSSEVSATVSSTCGAPSRMATSAFVTAGIASRSTSTSAAASVAAVSLTATTAATAWPPKKTRSTARGLSGPLAVEAGAAPVQTPATPGAAAAAAVSIDLILAAGSGDRKGVV